MHGFEQSRLQDLQLPRKHMCGWKILAGVWPKLARHVYGVCQLRAGAVQKRLLWIVGRLRLSFTLSRPVFMCGSLYVCSAMSETEP